MGALLALLALLGIMDGVEPLMVWVSGFPFLCLPLCLASSHIPNPCTSHSATPLLLGCDFSVFFFLFFVIRHGLWDLSSPTRDQTWAPGSGSRVLTPRPPGKSQPLAPY